MTTQPKISQAARQAAQKFIYGLYVYRGRSPEFMQAKVSQLSESIQSAIDAETAQLRAAAEDYRKALDFYAQRKNYRRTGWQGDQDPAPIEMDEGKQARAILAKHAPNSAQ